MIKSLQSMALQDYKMAAWQKPETHRNLNDITSICIVYRYNAQRMKTKDYLSVVFLHHI